MHVVEEWHWVQLSTVASLYYTCGHHGFEGKPAVQRRTLVHRSKRHNQGAMRTTEGDKNVEVAAGLILLENYVTGILRG